MDYTITIPDELTPGIVATASLEGKTPEEVIGAYFTTLQVVAQQPALVVYPTSM